MPAAKKHASTRARANKASTAATLPSELDAADVDIPELPEREYGWHAQTREWWTDVWSSPMSKEWHPATDLHNVVMAAMHLDDMWRAETATERQKADAAFVKRIAPLGLTPYDRRRLEWTIAAAGEATDRRRRTAQPAKTTEPKKDARPDPRVGLHAVS